jgi:osmoprotectant transport system permease protein
VLQADQDGRVNLLAQASGQPFIDWSWIADHTDDMTVRTVKHIIFTGIAVGLGFAISLVLSLVIIRYRWTYGPITGVAGLLYTIPSLALFGLLIPITGFTVTTAEIALVSYTLLILIGNTVAGFQGVPADAREAAQGMGYTPWRRFAQVDLPLATPAIIAGLRIATVTTVGLVTVTALIGLGGFGALINEGLSRQFPTLVIVGSVASVALAVVFDLLFVGLERLATPWARARGGGRSR